MKYFKILSLLSLYITVTSANAEYVVPGSFKTYFVGGTCKIQVFIEDRPTNPSMMYIARSQFTWNGPCLNGYAHGSGVLDYYTDGGDAPENIRESGTMVNGVFDGPIKAERRALDASKKVWTLWGAPYNDKYQMGCSKTDLSATDCKPQIKSTESKSDGKPKKVASSKNCIKITRTDKPNAKSQEATLELYNLCPYEVTVSILFDPENHPYNSFYYSYWGTTYLSPDWTSGERLPDIGFSPVLNQPDWNAPILAASAPYRQKVNLRKKDGGLTWKFVSCPYLDGAGNSVKLFRNDDHSQFACVTYPKAGQKPIISIGG